MSHAKKTAPDAEERYDIKILKNGTWLYAGTPILRENMVRLFSTVLRKDERGGYWLQTPHEKGRIEVEDAPFTAVEVRAEGHGEKQVLHFRTNVDDWVAAGPEHPLHVDFHPETGEPAPYIHVRDGLEARIVRAVYYDLAARAVESAMHKGLPGIWSGGVFFALGKDLS